MTPSEQYRAETGDDFTDMVTCSEYHQRYVKWLEESFTRITAERDEYAESLIQCLENQIDELSRINTSSPIYFYAQQSIIDIKNVINRIKEGRG